MALAAQRAPFLAPTRVAAVALRPVGATRPQRRQAQVLALFGGLLGGSKASGGAGKGGAAAAQQYSICVDCGYIYDGGDFKKAPGSYRCPVCNSPKSRFKAYKGAVKGRPNNSGAALRQRMQARQW